MFVFGRYLRKPDMPFVCWDLLSADGCNKKKLFFRTEKSKKQKKNRYSSIVRGYNCWKKSAGDTFLFFPGHKRLTQCHRYTHTYIRIFLRSVRDDLKWPSAIGSGEKRIRLIRETRAWICRLFIYGLPVNGLITF